jgi:intracellular sulfur oxidation DsrE/DsrF family protein
MCTLNTNSNSLPNCSMLVKKKINTLWNLKGIFFFLVKFERNFIKRDKEKFQIDAIIKDKVLVFFCRTTLLVSYINKNLFFGFIKYINYLMNLKNKFLF